MPMLERPGGAIWYEITDLTPPWIETPPTILFHHGVGINAKTWHGWLPALADLVIGTDLRPCCRRSRSRPGCSPPARARSSR